MAEPPVGLGWRAHPSGPGTGAERVSCATMTFPVVFHLGPLVVPAHTVFETLAYVAGFRLFLVLRAREGDPVRESTRHLVIAAAAVGALLGAYGLALAQHPFGPAAPHVALAERLRGKTIVGGLLGGMLAVELAKLAIGERRRTGDLFVLPLCVGIAVGRVGCFLAGLDDHTFGLATTLPWGLDLGDGVPRHPVTLYETLALALIAAWTLHARGRVGLREGDRFRGFLTLYLAFRLGLDLLKPAPRPWLGLSAIQVACVLGLGYLARDWPRLARGTFAARVAATSE
jgi:phosphatidylglycerol---prolipoprotein diacylglyceryl transferase